VSEQVRLAKASQRALCEKASLQGDLVTAAAHVFDKGVSRRLAALGTSSFDHWLHVVLFATGVMHATLPLLIALVFRGFGDRRIVNASAPALVVVSAFAVLVFCSVNFSFAIDSLRVRACMLISGHWLIFSATAVSCLFVAAHLWSCAHDKTVLLLSPTFSPPARSTPLSPSWFSADSAGLPRADGAHPLLNFARAYSAWTLAYLLAGLRVLATTQRFHHDELEALQGLLFGLVSVGVLLAIAGVANHWLRRHLHAKPS